MLQKEVLQGYYCGEFLFPLRFDKTVLVDTGALLIIQVTESLCSLKFSSTMVRDTAVSSLSSPTSPFFSVAQLY